MVCKGYGTVSEIGEPKTWNITNHWDRRSYSVFYGKQDLDFRDSYPNSSHFLQLRFNQSWQLDGHSKCAEKHWNRYVGCKFSKNQHRFQSCSLEKQFVIVRVRLSDLLSCECFMNLRACSSIKQLQDCRRCTKLRLQARKEDELLETDLLESTVNLVETREDECGISGASAAKSLGDQSDLVHKAQRKDHAGGLRREFHRKRQVFQDKNCSKNIKSHVKRSKFQRLYGAILSADDDEKIQNIISKVGEESGIKFCNFLLKSLEKEDEDKALSLFNLMRKSGRAKGNLFAYNIAFRLLSRRENWSAVETLLEEIRLDPGCELNSQIFNTLIYACSKKGLVQWGAKWFREMVEEGVQPTEATYGMLMILYQKAGNLHEAEFTFEHMKSSGIHCCGAYSAMITIYSRLNLYEKAEVVIDLMNEKQVSPNQENWLVQLNTYSQQGKLQAAEKVMHLMKESGLAPNIIAFNSLITGYGKVGLLKQAVSLFENLQNVGLKPDEATYRSMIEGCGKAGRLKEALWYYNEMKTNGFHPSPLNLKTIINLLAKFNDEEGAVQILSDMRDIRCEDASIIQILVQAYERADRINKVPSILKAFLHERGQLGETASAILVLAYARNGMLAEALEFLQEIPGADTTFNEGLYHVLICSFKEAGNCEGAAQIFSTMTKGSVDPNLQITCTMIDVYSTMGLFAKAQDLYLQLKSSNTKLDMVTYSVVVKMYLNANLPNNAAQVLEMMENQNDIKPDSCLFHYMLRVYHKCNIPEKAAEVYYRILRAKLKWDGAMYNCIINCCGRALPVDETSKIFDDMLKSGFFPNTITFNVMIDIYGKTGLLTKAYEVLRLARKQGLSDIISYNTLISAYGKWKDYTGMEETFKEIQRGGFVVSLEAYNSMLDAYGKSGQLKEFGNVLERMSRAGCYFDLYTYNIMINVYGKNGLIDEITDLLIRLKKEGLEPNIWTYNTLIGAYGVAGMPDEAVRVVKEMQSAEIQPDRITYVNLISTFEKSDNFLEAARWSLWMKQAGMAR